MSLSKPVSPTGRKRRIDRDFADDFPLLKLPNELISHSLSFLPIKDRLNARANKRLNAIEQNTHFYVEKLTIREEKYPVSAYENEKYIDDDYRLNRNDYPASEGEFDEESPYYSDNLNNQTIILRRDTPNVSAFLRKLTSNTFIGSLIVRLEMERKKMVDSFLLDLSRMCKSLSIVSVDFKLTSRYCNNKITERSLYEIYKSVKEGSTRLRELKLTASRNACIRFLHLLDIKYEGEILHGELYSNNTTVEAYSEGTTNGFETGGFIFDGNIEIEIDLYQDKWIGEMIYDEDDDDEDPVSILPSFHLKLHETQDSLEVAKSSKHKVEMKPWSWFPLLELPDKVISHIFSFLPFTDRLSARVNKRLDKIESESTFYQENLAIEEHYKCDRNPGFNRYSETCIMFDKRTYSDAAACIKRISKNMSIGRLKIADEYDRVAGYTNFHRDAYNIVKGFRRVDSLDLSIKYTGAVDFQRDFGRLIHDFKVNKLDFTMAGLNRQRRTPISDLPSSLFMNLITNCKILYLNYRRSDVSAHLLHYMYKNMQSGDVSTPNSRHVVDVTLPVEESRCASFFNAIGITYLDGALAPRTEGLEVFARGMGNDYRIFDGNLEIRFTHNVDTSSPTLYSLRFIAHQTRKSLEKAKMERGRYRVEPARSRSCL